MELRRMLQPGKQVRVAGLSTLVDGKIGRVVRLADRGISSDSITDEGFWTIAFPDRVDGGELHHEVQRKYLRDQTRKRTLRRKAQQPALVGLPPGTAQIPA